MDLEVGEGGQERTAEEGQPGLGIDVLRPAGVVDSGVGSVAGGEGVDVVAV